jgi:hypothetical protein
MTPLRADSILITHNKNNFLSVTNQTRLSKIYTGKSTLNITSTQKNYHLIKGNSSLEEGRLPYSSLNIINYKNILTGPL